MPYVVTSRTDKLYCPFIQHAWAGTAGASVMKIKRQQLSERLVFKNRHHSIWSKPINASLVSKFLQVNTDFFQPGQSIVMACSLKVLCVVQICLTCNVSLTRRRIMFQCAHETEVSNTSILNQLLIPGYSIQKVVSSLLNMSFHHTRELQIKILKV